MTENLQGKRIFIKNFENNIYYVKQDDNKYIQLIELICDKNTTIDNLKLLDNTIDILIYKHYNETHTDIIIKLHKKSYENKIIIIDNIFNLYTVTKQINNNIFYYSLHYNYEY